MLKICLNTGYCLRQTYIFQISFPKDRWIGWIFHTKICYQKVGNHYAKFEIDKTIITFLNKRKELTVTEIIEMLCFGENIIKTTQHSRMLIKRECPKVSEACYILYLYILYLYSVKGESTNKKDLYIQVLTSIEKLLFWWQYSIITLQADVMN